MMKKKIIILLCGLLLAPTVLASVITQEDEKTIGADFYSEFTQKASLLKDAIVTDYINQLGKQLVQYSNNPTQALHIFIIKNPNINAFAVPGGYIGINTGLITEANSDGELAAVLAHEISHITQHHYARSQNIETGAQLAMIAGMFAAVALGAGSPNIASGASMALAAGGVQSYLNYSRAQEQEADRMGMIMMAKAGYDPKNMELFFNHLYQKTDSFFEAISTHPFASTRMADVENQIASLGKKIYKKKDPLFDLIRERVIVETAGGQLKGLIANIKARLEKAGNTQPALEYGYALALSKDHQETTALTILKKLSAQDPDQIIYYMSIASLEKKQGQIQEAIKTLQPVEFIYPSYWPLFQEYVATLALGSAAQKKEGLELLRNREEDYQKNSAFYGLLATTEDANNNKLKAYFAREKMYELNQNPKAALLQLYAALQLPSLSEGDKKVVGNKIKALEKQLRR